MLRLTGMSATSSSNVSLIRQDCLNLRLTLPLVEVPLDIHSEVATYETQFGFVQRPTHKNTTWDAAKFEVCGHKVFHPSKVKIVVVDHTPFSLPI